MLGAIVGDFVGSVHEHMATKRKDFPLVDLRCAVTDDSLLTVAVAEWLLDGTDLVTRFHDLVAAYPRAGWGSMFARWAEAGNRAPYHSFGNGAAMRVSPVGWAFASLDETLAAAAVFLARMIRDKALMRDEIASMRRPRGRSGGRGTRCAAERGCGSSRSSTPTGLRPAVLKSPSDLFKS